MSLSEHMNRLKISDAALAETLGLSPEAIRLWRHEKRRISAERAIEIEFATGIPRHELRPDIYPAPTPTQEAA